MSIISKDLCKYICDHIQKDKNLEKIKKHCEKNNINIEHLCDLIENITEIPTCDSCQTPIYLRLSGSYIEHVTLKKSFQPIGVMPRVIYCRNCYYVLIQLPL